MNEVQITGSLVILVIAIIGAIAGAWWRVELAISRAKREAIEQAGHAGNLATLTQSQLSEFRTHVAENYISKAGFRETMENLSETLKTINANLTHLNERIDRVIDNQNGGSAKRGGQQ